MKHEVLKCEASDIDSIFELYEHARNMQKSKRVVIWPDFEYAKILQELVNGLHWKICLDGKIVCNWVIAFEDRQIWEDQDQNDGLYIHRIAVHSNYRGFRFIDTIVAWARDFAYQNNRRFIRLDTLGNNVSLVKHYSSAGFRFLGIFELADTTGLPQHYQDHKDCLLFEIDLEAG